MVGGVPGDRKRHGTCRGLVRLVYFCPVLVPPVPNARICQVAPEKVRNVRNLDVLVGIAEPYPRVLTDRHSNPDRPPHIPSSVLIELTLVDEQVDAERQVRIKKVRLGKPDIKLFASRPDRRRERKGFSTSPEVALGNLALKHHFIVARIACTRGNRSRLAFLYLDIYVGACFIDALRCDLYVVKKA